jgi:Mg2+ and Co2+ transporter CorA
MTNDKEDEHMTDNSFFTNGIHAYDNLADFANAITKVTGIDFKLDSVIGLNSDFSQSTEQYLLLNVKEYKKEQGEDLNLNNNLLFLTDDGVYFYSQEPLSMDTLKVFQDLLLKPFGKSTALTFVILDRALETYDSRLDILSNRLMKLEGEFSRNEYLRLGLEFERFSDRLDEFRSLLIKLQERRIKQVETSYISFDYGILIAEASSLQGRARRRLATLQAFREDYEMRNTEELNQRVIKLNDVVKKLTAITVILMLPTLIASHFGMNFAFMPELKIQWVYPLVIGVQFILMGAGIFLFKKIGWL